MLAYPRSKDRPFHLGPFPLESLPTDPAQGDTEIQRKRCRAAESNHPDSRLAAATLHYRDIFAKFVDGTPAPMPAPVPNDLHRRSINIKGAAYFLDAAQAGICNIPLGVARQRRTGP